MKILSWLCYLLIGCSSCIRLTNGSTLHNFNNQYGVNALLNDSIWFGNAHAYNDDFVKVRKSCPAKRFVLSFHTDLPYNRSLYNSKVAITGCMNKCLPTQILSFPSIPLAVGRYSLSSLKNCLVKTQTKSNYMLLVGGDVAVDDFYETDGWIKVTKYDSLSKKIEGIFEVTLTNKEGKVARFQQGAFKTNLMQY